MKLAGSIGRQMVRPQIQPKMVHQIAVIGGWKHLAQPTLSSELECPICKEKSHLTPLINPSLGDERVWMCGNVSCFIYKKENGPMATTTPPIPKRAVLWPLFCEINDIGNTHHDVLFEKIEQSQGKIDYLKKFVAKPNGIIIMRGKPGQGKTYCALGVCEYFTRTSVSANVTTQKQLLEKWLENNTTQKYSNYFRKLKEINLLVIDDFGTSDISPGFMGFIMDLINTRMQWNDRGTIITTNLDKNKLSDFCGDALMDRLNTGQQFSFEGDTRREKTIL
jgi:hypothetical protein